MLISCPKCRSIYEIPDNLVGKTGKNFRCQGCSTIWHAMPEDALGYQKNKDEKPFIEEIEVKEPPYREYPANKEEYSVPLDNPMMNKSLEVEEKLAEKAFNDFVNTVEEFASNNAKEEEKVEFIDTFSSAKDEKNTGNEIVLTSDAGTSFTISVDNNFVEDKKTPHLFSNDSGLKAERDKRITLAKPFRGYKFVYFVLFIVAVLSLVCFFRREIVSLYPKAEEYYNRVMLSGLNNFENLKFENMNIVEKVIDNNSVIVIEAIINNDAFYSTYVPNVKVRGQSQEFEPHNKLLKSHEKTGVEVIFKAPENNEMVNLTLEFVKK